ncbi:MAG: ComEC/Rec2 family competence protein [Candidatus Pacebacteria bacterium]|nr:ComEC/Rec2 family competence protein [Candidatus Paceibacterota bacterium]
MKRGVFIFWSVFIVAAAARWVFSSVGNDGVSILCVKENVTGNGIITKEPERKEGGQVFVVAAERIIAQERECATGVNIRMKAKLYPRFEYGDEISFEGKISQPFNFKSESGRSFDYQGYLAKDDIYYEIKSAKAEVVSSKSSVASEENRKDIPVKIHEVSYSPQGKSIGERVSAVLYSIKRGFVSNLEKVLGEPHAALAAGLVVGEKSALGKDLLEDFRVVGLIHIIVLSGFNITIVGDAMRRILSFLPRVWGIVVGGIGIVLFGVMVGGGATVVRSCFMASIALSADLIRRDYNVVRALIFAGLLMVIQNPSIILHDPSFQLSFMATLGLIILASPIEKKIGFITERFGIRGIVASTIATQIFVSPYILYMMGTISIIGMIVNILVLPIIPATMLVVFLAGAFGFIWMPLAQLFGWVSHLLLSYELFMVESFARVPYASLSVPIFSKWWVVGFYVVFGVVYFGRKFRKNNSH